ncbi:MAG: S8 family serine peptidase [Clostridia bacterium]|nr:S8 family serine peptidase [Clostridia bacterium]
MHNYYDGNFESGKVIVALNKSIDYIGRSIDTIFCGIDYEEIETIFHPEEKRKEDDVGDVILIHLRRKDKLAVIDAIENLLTNPDVVYAEPDYLYDFHRIPDDPLFRNLWGIERIQAPSAWDRATGSRDVLVGVLDTGVDGDHPDLRANLLVPRKGRFADYRDLSGHGTHVAGTIGAIGNNHVGVVGVCWDIGLVILNIGNTTIDLASAMQAINFAARKNIPILNNSWGGRQNSSALRYAIQQYGGLFIASAGNNGTNNDSFPMYPASYNLDNIISVAALNPNNALAPFSNFGAESVHIAAPGTGILSTDLCGGYSNMNGTSMAAPHVAGAAALLRAFKPHLTIHDMRNIVLSSVTRVPDLNGRVTTGGMLNVSAMLEQATGFA